VQDVILDPDLLWNAGFVYKGNPDTGNPSAFIDWFSHRYPHAWERNVYVQVAKIEYCQRYKKEVCFDYELTCWVSADSIGNIHEQGGK
jgi:hypothetical protein